MVVNTHEAKTHLSRLIERAAAGEEIILAKAGKPMAKLVRYEAPTTPRRPGMGAMAGTIRMADDFDETPQEIIDAFEGE
jgi:prevent-host-death family protein